MIDLLKNKVAGAAGALALLAGGGAAQAHDTALDIAPEVTTAGPALWQVADDDTTIYLFGTVHALPEDIEWYDGRIAGAFDASDEFVTEIDMSQANTAGPATLARAALPAGTTLRSLMTDENRAEYEGLLTSLGMPVEALDTVEPWFAALNLSLLSILQGGYSPDSGVEMTLTGRADDKTHGALETVEEQIALFDTLPMDAQLTFLDETVDKIPRTAEMLNAMVAEWAKGDADALAEIMNAEMDDPALYKRLLTDRNANWADWIETRMEQPGKVFIAVGAGHLAGKGSVQEQLQAKGIDVTRIE